MGKSTHVMGKVWVSISQTFPVPWWVLLHFPVQLWDIYGEIYTFPLWWHWLIFSCETKETSFHRFPNVFPSIFTQFIENRWEYPYLPHMDFDRFFLCELCISGSLLIRQGRVISLYRTVIKWWGKNRAG